MAILSRGKCRASILANIVLVAGFIYLTSGSYKPGAAGEDSDPIAVVSGPGDPPAEQRIHEIHPDVLPPAAESGESLTTGGNTSRKARPPARIPPNRERVYKDVERKDHRKATIIPTTQHDDPVFHPRFWDAVVEFDDGLTFIKTGDIHDMWIRDSAAQMWHSVRSTDERTVALVVRVLNMQAYYIHQDPYANSYSLHWRDPARLPQHEKRLGRGNWVATYNYELDSGAYFVRLLYHMWLKHPQLINLKGAFEDAIQTWLRTISTEQDHSKSPYTYAELPRLGKGPQVQEVGLTWSCYRPSDDRCEHGYNIPGNLFAAMALQWITVLYEGLSPDIVNVASRIRKDILAAIKLYGVYEDRGIHRYCYEVDGMGNCNKMDDANVPSLLSLPYLDEEALTYDATIYENTRSWILSSSNPYYFDGSQLRGVSSPHTINKNGGSGRNVWPMALMMQGFTSKSRDEQKEMYDMVVKTMHGGKFVHESVDVDNVEKYTRSWFGWADVLWKEYTDRFKETI